MTSLSVRSLLVRWSLAVLVLGPVSSAAAQVVDAGDRLAKRDVLQAELSRYEQLSNSPAYSETSRTRARRAAEQVRRRLTDGDFRAGDLVVLQIEGPVPFNDTLVVTNAITIDATGVGSISLRGTLRSELLSKVRDEVLQGVRTATVTAAYPLFSVAVFGSVARPGYFAVSDEIKIDQLITLAGGPTAAADPNNLLVRRGDEVVLSSKAVSNAIVQRRAIADLRLAEGDVLEVGERKVRWDRATTIQIVSLVLGPVITVLLVR